MTKLFYTLSILFIFSLLAHPQGAITDTLAPEVTITPDKLCGVRSLYLALKSLGEKNVDYDEIQEYFPGAQTEGTSLKELADFLAKRNLANKYMQVNKTVLQNINANVIIFVLKPTGDFAHIHLLRKLDEGRFQIIDSPNTHIERKIEEFGDGAANCLLVARKVEDLPKERNLFPTFPSNALFAAGFCLLLYSLLKRRVKHAET